MAGIISSTLFPRSWSKGDSSQRAPPSLLGRQVGSLFLGLSKRACAHPIYTIVSVAILASTTYIGLLENSLFDKRISANNAVGKIDLKNILTGSKRLYAGPETDWKWSPNVAAAQSRAEDDLALITLVFPDSAQGNYKASPQPRTISIPSNSSARALPTSSNLLSPISYDYTLAFSLPFAETSDFLSSIKELSVAKDESQKKYLKQHGVHEERKWIMRAVRNPASTGLRHAIYEKWTDFLDLLKNADTLDIGIMLLGYLAMYVTFFSLFMALRELGSKFWIGFTVLLSGIYALLFGMTVTTRLGVPLNMVLLSEGLPFLVVTIGFEKPIHLTKAVLAASIHRKARSPGGKSRNSNSGLPSIQRAVQIAVKDHGWLIVRDYMVEIAILSAGALSGVQGGLRQFCFLACWILFFDCILLFTFFTAILTVKLEINRIKRHVELRKALEDDGISRRVAENVAASNDHPGRRGSATQADEAGIFGKGLGDRAVPKFKAIMVGGFITVNLLNSLAVKIRGQGPLELASLSKLVTQPALDPYTVAGNGLDSLLVAAIRTSRPTVVTVLAPIKYELTYPSIHYSPNESDATDVLYDKMGGKVVGGLLKSFEDPILSKWIVAALVISLALNGYLFNAARWTIKEPVQVHRPAKDSEVLDNPDARSSPGFREEVPQPKPAPVIREPVEQESEPASPTSTNGHAVTSNGIKRSKEECERLLKEKRAKDLYDEELIDLSSRGKIPGYALEKTLGDMTRAVKIRRAVVSRTHATRDTSTYLERSKLPYQHFDYERVHGACCENVIGYMPLPVGVAGPLNIDGQNYFLPMATTEGVLVASTSRGCKAINAGGGAVTVLTSDGMTRGPCVVFDTLTRAGQAKLWLDSEDGQRTMKDAFNSTSRFARLQYMKTALAGTNLYIRFKTTTGDAMGMNMISKGVEHALHVMSTEAGFDDMQVITVSGNYCTDKKAAAINWIDGRGKGVVAEAIIPPEVVRNVLKSNVDALVELNIAKNLIGSAMAGSIGGFNAHAANIVAAIFLATGQDPAQVVESANCITVMKNYNGSLQISVSMPSIEVGTIGGGTILEPQSAMLDLLGVRGAHPSNPGDNARQLARVIASGVLAGELSLCSALAAGHLVQAHMAHNRSQQPSRAVTPSPGTPTTPANVAPLTMTSVNGAAPPRK